MRVDGRALDMQQIRTADSPKGDLTVAHSHVSELGRYSDVATLRSSQNVNESVLPPLYDVRLSFMGTNGFVLTGLSIDGPLAVAQSWWCRPA
jgi:hypothetical protein